MERERPNRGNGRFPGASSGRGDGGCCNEFDLVASEIRMGLQGSRYVPLSAAAEVMGLLEECQRQLGLRYPRG